MNLCIKSLFVFKRAYYFFNFFILFLFSSISYANEKQIQPTDFAFGAKLILSESAAFYQAKIPSEIYDQAVWSDLRDVQIFDQDGKPVAFSFIYYDDIAEKLEQVQTKIEMLDHRLAKKGKSHSQLINENNDLLLLPNKLIKQSNQSYLITVPERDDALLPIKLRLHWQKALPEWQTKISLYWSNNLKQWKLLAKEIVLTDRIIEEEHLLINEIPITANEHPVNYYWLVTQDKASYWPLIDDVFTIYQIQPEQRYRVGVNFTTKAINDKTIEYHLPMATMLTSITFLPNQANSVFTANLAYRSDENAKWIALPKQIIYQFNKYSYMPALQLNNKVVQAVQLTIRQDDVAVKQAPILRGERQQAIIIFSANENNRVPYTLVWGSRLAKANAQPIDVLLPNTLRNTEAMHKITWAEIAETETLCGSPCLQQIQYQEKKGFSWQNTLKWLSAIALIIFIGYYAIRYRKEE